FLIRKYDLEDDKLRGISRTCDQGEELDAEIRIIDEFRDLNNSQVFEHVFGRRMMALRRGVTVPRSPSDFLGVDSRELMYPSLRETLHSVINDNAVSKDINELHLLDVGAGSGEAIDWFFAKELEGWACAKEEDTKNRKIFIHAIEPNPTFLKAYQQKLLEYQYLNQGMVYQGPIQDYLGNVCSETLPMPPVPVDFIFDLQKYLRTDFKKPNIDPKQDIIKFITFSYGLLKPGGAIYIAFLDMSSAFASLACKFYEEIVGDFETPKRISQTIKARNELLYEGNILEFLLGDAEQKEKTRPKLISHRSPSGFFARTLSDMAVLALSELLEIGDSKFDKRALDFMITQLKLAVRTPGEKKPFGLTKCIRGGENVWRVDHSLIICVIRKELMID
ncbi:7816_t:CDS:2, partial [Acaulospora morrowiae]